MFQIIKSFIGLVFLAIMVIPSTIVSIVNQTAGSINPTTVGQKFATWIIDQFNEQAPVVKATPTRKRATSKKS